MTTLIDTLFKGLSTREIEEILFGNADNRIKFARMGSLDHFKSGKYRSKNKKPVEQKLYN